MGKRIEIIFSIMLISFQAVAGGFDFQWVDDRDLSPLQIVAQAPSLELGIDHELKQPTSSGLLLEVTRVHHGFHHPMIHLPIQFGSKTFYTDAQGQVDLSELCQNGETKAQGTLKLENDHFAVTNGDGTYRFDVKLDCSTETRWNFDPDSVSGQALGIWEIAQAAQDKLSETVSLSFWDRQLTFVWPSNGDYYFWGSVNLTRGDHWDVVGHELGHAIYDLADIGGFGGGPHRIDECYSAVLALSEGWASYFGAWVAISLSDPDAKFEYMVPRRAPIRVENVPEDVCRSEKNEWRVTAFFWDLIDLNDDGEISNEQFSRVWNALENSGIQSASQAKGRLKTAGLPENELDQIWTLNF